MYKDPFEEYLRAQEPGRKQLGYAWQTAVGLQKVDDLEPSRYLIETAKKKHRGRNHAGYGKRADPWVL